MFTVYSLIPCKSAIMGTDLLGLGETEWQAQYRKRIFYRFSMFGTSADIYSHVLPSFLANESIAHEYVTTSLLFRKLISKS